MAMRYAIEGLAAAYGQVRDAYAGREPVLEVLSAGCFRQSLRSGAEIACLLEHDPAARLASTRRGDLQIADDDSCLGFRVRLPETALARQTLDAVRRRRLTKVSIGFTITDARETMLGGRRFRIIRAAKLREISLTAGVPVDPETHVYAIDVDRAPRFGAINVGRFIGMARASGAVPKERRHPLQDAAGPWL